MITPQEFADFRPDISPAWKKEEAKIQRCIDEAVEVDLYDVLGSFYFDVDAKKADPTFSNLMNGSTFEIEGKPHKHPGLKKYIAGLAYVRYLALTNKVHTAHGYVNKVSQGSEPVNYNEIRDAKKDIQQTNEILFVRVDKYLRSNPELFANYTTGNNPDINTNSVKTSTLR